MSGVEYKPKFDFELIIKPQVRRLLILGEYPSTQGPRQDSLKTAFITFRAGSLRHFNPSETRLATLIACWAYLRLPSPRFFFFLGASIFPSSFQLTNSSLRNASSRFKRNSDFGT